MAATNEVRKKKMKKKPSKSNKSSPGFAPNKDLHKKNSKNNQKSKWMKNPNYKEKSRKIDAKEEKLEVVVEEKEIVTAGDYTEFFVEQFEFANSIKLSSLELDSLQETYFIKLSDGISQDATNLGTHIKEVFGSKWKETLCETRLVEGKINAGNPAVLVISASALKSLEMLRGLRILTKECQAVKLFSKHIKVDEQVTMLKKRVNIASGTPNRIKKLAEMEALGLSRLSVIVLDMRTDVKGYSLFTLPQIRDEFWDLYKTYFHQRLLQGSLRVCLYGPISSTTGRNIKKAEAL